MRVGYACPTCGLRNKPWPGSDDPTYHWCSICQAVYRPATSLSMDEEEIRTLRAWATDKAREATTARAYRAEDRRRLNVLTERHAHALEALASIARLPGSRLGEAGELARRALAAEDDE